MYLAWLALFVGLVWAEDGGNRTQDVPTLAEDGGNKTQDVPTLARVVANKTQDVPKSTDDGKNQLEDPLKGLSDWFKNGTAKSLDAVKEKSQSSLLGMKSLGDRFGLAKEKIAETGEKMKEAFGDAALNAKGEFESAASKTSKHAKEAGALVMGMFG